MTPPSVTRSSSLARPLVAIIADLDANTDSYRVHPSYVRAVEASGGLPVIVPYTRDARDWLDRVQAVILHGGVNDIDPTRYGGPDTRARSVRAERDVFEFNLVEESFRRDTPLLAICRGAQVLNVAFGGSLYTDVPSDLPGLDHPHQQGRELEAVAHEVVLDPDSVLHRVVGADRIVVNSAHHQAIRDVPAKLRIAARSTDGLIEAVEARERTFMVGVQWHPERLAHADPLSARLFQALIYAAQRS